jgi:hypothetical protein
MPREDFYQGLTLREQVQRFADHHSHPRNRHISRYEHALLDQFVARLDETYAIATETALAELTQVWESANQYYETNIGLEAESGLSITSIPPQSLVESPIQLLEDFGLEEITSSAGSMRLQASVAALLALGGVPATTPELLDLVNELADHPSRVESRVSATRLSVLNRVYYLPVVPLEKSPPFFQSLRWLEAAESPAAPVIVLGGALALTGGNVVIAVIAGGSVILLRVATAFGRGLEPSAEALGEEVGRRLLKRVGHTEDE